MRKSRGFSLIELLIVVAIILIIAAIAVPSLLRAKMSANDSAAASTIRIFSTAQITYATNYPTVGFSSTLRALGPNSAPPLCDATGACLIDNVLACASAASGPCPKSGYNYFMTGGPPAPSGIVENYAGSASPVVVNSTGTNNFCSTEDMVVRSFRTAAPPPSTLPPALTAPESIANCQTLTMYGAIQ